MTAFFWILRKDLAVFFADGKGAAMVIVVPLVLGLLMGTIFDPGDGPSAIELAVVDEDGGPAVTRLIERLDAEASIAVQRMTAEEAREAVGRGKLGVAVRFAAGSDAHLSATSLFAPAGERHAITLWFDPSQKTEADIAGGLLTKVMMETVFSDIANPSAQRKMFGDLRANMGPVEARPELARFLDQGMAFSDESGAAATTGAGGGMSLQPPLDIVPEAVVAAGPTAGFNSYAHTFAGMLMQFLLFAASGHAKTLLAERGSGTLDRLRMTRARPAAILLGAAGGVACISVLSTLVIFGTGILLFDIELRSGVPAFALMTVAQALFVGSFAILLAGVARSEKQIDAVGTLLILFLCMVSGAWVPSFMLPGFMQELGPLIPTRWVLDGMAGATWRGLGFPHALQCAGALIGFSALLSTIAIRRFRWS